MRILKYFLISLTALFSLHAFATSHVIGCAEQITCSTKGNIQSCHSDDPKIAGWEIDTHSAEAICQNNMTFKLSTVIYLYYGTYQSSDRASCLYESVPRSNCQGYVSTSRLDVGNTDRRSLAISPAGGWNYDGGPYRQYSCPRIKSENPNICQLCKESCP